MSVINHLQNQHLPDIQMELFVTYIVLAIDPFVQSLERDLKLPELHNLDDEL